MTKASFGKRPGLRPWSPVSPPMWRSKINRCHRGCHSPFFFTFRTMITAPVLQRAVPGAVRQPQALRAKCRPQSCRLNAAKSNRDSIHNPGVLDRRDLMLGSGLVAASAPLLLIPSPAGAEGQSSSKTGYLQVWWWYIKPPMVMQLRLWREIPVSHLGALL